MHRFECMNKHSEWCWYTQVTIHVHHLPSDNWLFFWHGCHRPTAPAACVVSRCSRLQCPSGKAWHLVIRTCIVWMNLRWTPRMQLQSVFVSMINVCFYVIWFLFFWILYWLSLISWFFHSDPEVDCHRSCHFYMARPAQPSRLARAGVISAIHVLSLRGSLEGNVW